jgi:hypothetical protein
MVQLGFPLGGPPWNIVEAKPTTGAPDESTHGLLCESTEKRVEEGRLGLQEDQDMRYTREAHV